MWVYSELCVRAGVWKSPPVETLQMRGSEFLQSLVQCLTQSCNTSCETSHFENSLQIKFVKIYLLFSDVEREAEFSCFLIKI